jgi:hypothetical protein
MVFSVTVIHYSSKFFLRKEDVRRKVPGTPPVPGTLQLQKKTASNGSGFF